MVGLHWSNDTGGMRGDVEEVPTKPAATEQKAEELIN